jgi:RNA polymerase sigma-70 factor (ECF subfamily)
MTEQQFEQIFKEHFTFLSNVAYTVVNNEDDAYDIAQQVFIKFWDKKDTININDNIKSYLHRATVNTAINFIKKDNKTVKFDDISSTELTDSTTETKIEISEENIQEIIKDAISNLPEKCKLVFSLSRYSDMTNKEIAEHLDISIKAVEKHISRALKELRITLKPYMNYFGFFLLLEVGILIF